MMFDTSKMREHLISCLKNKEMRLFPEETTKRVKKCSTQRVLVPLYCHCRLPYFPSKDHMALCVSCKQWFHYKCESIHKSRSLKKTNWKCKDCMSHHHGN